jgi:hypothetical protein
MSHKIKTIFIGKWGLVKGNVRVNIDLSRFQSQYQEAQTALDRAVMLGMEKYMPKVTGNFIQRTKAISESMAGSGRVCGGAGPMGRFLYEGFVMVGETSRSPWAMKGEKKVVTDRPLKYTTTFNPDAQAHWFEPAKAEFGSAWVKLAKEKAGGGKRG